MKKIVLVGVLLMLIATIFVFSRAPIANAPQKVNENKKQELIGLAKKRYKEEKAKGTNLQKGPCLGLIAVGWVADIVHSPRQPIDNKPENQCEAYREGSVKNFIELDTHGNFVGSS